MPDRELTPVFVAGSFPAENSAKPLELPASSDDARFNRGVSLAPEKPVLGMRVTI
jgi:hypothetical protein